MKIALVVHDYHRSGGHSRYVAELAERFARDHEVHVFANRMEPASGHAIHSHHVPAWRANALTTILTFVLPATLKLSDRFDVVHAQGLCCWRQDVITAHICQGAWFDAQAGRQGGLTWRQRLFRGVVERLERIIYEPAHSPHVIAISENIREDLGQYYGRSENVTVIMHGVDAERFHPRRRLCYRDTSRMTLGLAASDFVALYVGDLQKGAPAAIEAIALTSDTRLVLVSRSDPHPYLKLAEQFDVSDRVVFSSPSNEIERIYAAADVFLFPTFYDAFGMVITEAMAMGLPVITSRAAGAAALIADGESSILVDPPHDTQAFARALRDLRGDAQLRDRMGNEARRTIEGLTWDKVAQDTLRVYQHVISQRVAAGQSGRPVIAFLVNGGQTSAVGVRARVFADRLNSQYQIHLLYRPDRKVQATWRFVAELRRIRPGLSYVFDMGYSGVLAAALYKLWTGNRLIIETGDVIYELARSLGTRGRIGLWLTRLLETLSYLIADRIVVRGTRHREWLADHGIDNVTVIQDGVDTDVFQPLDATTLRHRHHLEGVLTVGLVGTVVWNERYDIGYGWELVEVIRLLKDTPVKGVLIGDGPGLPRLKARAREYGIEDRILFLGYIPHDQLPMYLNLIDICLSTQTNDLVGQVRTTGKLPLYLATGRHILASRVGEASLVLPEQMLVDYEGVKDPEYPQRLAARISSLQHHPTMSGFSQENVQTARQSFAYPVLAGRMANVIRTVLRA